MAQYTEGVARVLSANHVRVVLTGGITTDNVQVGDLFRFKGDYAGIYYVGAIVDGTTFDLTAPYIGGRSFDTDYEYLIARDFTPFLMLPETVAGDVDIREIYTLCVRLIDVAAESVLGAGQGLDGFPTGTRMIFDQDTPPIGWTRVTDEINDRLVRLVSGERQHGGSWTVVDGVGTGPDVPPVLPSPFTTPYIHWDGQVFNGQYFVWEPIGPEGSPVLVTYTTDRVWPPSGVSMLNTADPNNVTATVPPGSLPIADASARGHTHNVSGDGTWRPLHRDMILAGSALTPIDSFRNVVRLFHQDLAAASRVWSADPALDVGVDDLVGLAKIAHEDVEVGPAASAPDLVESDEEVALAGKHVVHAGAA